MAKSSNELAEDRTLLAGGRTLMAADRTLMAWVRTALSLISFGFTIYKVLEGLQGSGVNLRDVHMPRTLGLFLTGLGTLAMAAGCLEYWHRIRLLRGYHVISIWRPVFVIALIMAATGLFFFVSITLRVL